MFFFCSIMFTFVMITLIVDSYLIFLQIKKLTFKKIIDSIQRSVIKEMFRK